MAVSNVKAAFQSEIQKVWETAKKVFMKPFVKAYLKKQQTQYVSDFRKALS